MPRYPAIFLDRDGTINEEMGYLNHLSRLRILRGVPEALKRLQKAGFKLFVVTNQSGPARGYFPKELVYKINTELSRRLKRHGVVIEDFFICFHHPNDNCPCRKPKTGLIEEALRRYPIDTNRVYIIGDRLNDVELAKRSGFKGILVLTGYGRGEAEYLLPQSNIKPDYIAKDLREAADFILKDSNIHQSCDFS
ncbi:MAG: HAD family hydrolase [Caldimicrobium sp.]|nr:HAD family hydrolase [Caldimicrobium sp.]MCX7613889.1 HAD family hydrolase [Caldimicrobium sp.]MDW8183439.1 HAD family hydrolase [Caldimicrobium sp.]